MNTTANSLQGWAGHHQYQSQHRGAGFMSKHSLNMNFQKKQMGSLEAVALPQSQGTHPQSLLELAAQGPWPTFPM